MTVFLFILLFILLFVFLFYLSFFIVGKILERKETPAVKKEKLQAPDLHKLTNFFKPFKARKDSAAHEPPASDEIRYCPYCDSKVPKRARKCWHCKNRLPVSKSNIIASIIVGFVCLFIVVFALSSLASRPSSTAPTISKSEYISRCRTISYESLARNPDSHRGDYFTFTGEVIQVMEQGSYVNLRVNVTAETLFEETYFSDTIFVVAALPDDGDRILEGDIITLYGVCDGLYSYTTVLGSTMSIPKIDAAYWDIK